MSPPRTKFPRLCAAALFVSAAIAGAAEPELPPEAVGRLGSHGFVHPETVLQLAFIEGDRRIVSNCGDDFLRIWDVEFAKVLQQLPEKGASSQPANSQIPAGVKRRGINGPNSVASADGRFVASGGNSGAALRDAATRKVIAKLPGETRALDFSPDGRLLAAAMEDAPVTDKSWYDALKVIDTSTGLEKWQSREGYHQVAFSPDGTLLAASGFERVAVFDATTGRLVRELKYGGNEHAYAVAFSSDGKLLATGGDDARIRIWHTADWSELNPGTGHEGPVTSIAFSPDGATLATGGRDRSLRLWDWRAERELWKIPDLGAHWSVANITFSPDGMKIAAYATLGNRQNPISIRSSATGAALVSMDPRTNATALAFSPDSRQLFTSGRKGSIMIWDADTASLVRQIGQWKGDVTGLRVLPGGREVAWMGEYQGLGIRDLSTGNDVKIFKGGSHHGGRNLEQAGSLLSAGSRVWDLSSGEVISKSDGSGNSAPTTISADGRLVAWIRSGRIHIWELLTREEIHTFGPLAGDVYQLAFSPDGTTLASAEQDGSVLLWDATGGNQKPERVPDFDALWKKLGSDDGWAARQAVWQFAKAVFFPPIEKLREKLPPAVTPSTAQLDLLRNPLSDPDYDKRDEAARSLLDLGVALSPEEIEALRRPLPQPLGMPIVVKPVHSWSFLILGNPLEKVLPKHIVDVARESVWITPTYKTEYGPAPLLMPGPERLRQERAIEALEHCGSPEAISFLQNLAAGWPPHPQTIAAKAALERLATASKNGKPSSR